jgi:DNA (cytosine-5)-methyltransferase 1
MTAYYNEFDPFAAAWLRELIKAGHIAPGDVDDRSIKDVSADDLRGYTQCHFFAGIGVWSHALRRAGWSDERPVWTGSCPCQPFSAAGKGGGFDDARHLWPDFFRLIAECRPDVVLGEQVASKDGLAWLDLVYADPEGADYAVGAVDTCAAGFGAPHIRQRLYWSALADADHARLEGRIEPGRERDGELAAWPGGMAGGMADADGRHARSEREQCGGEQRQQPQDSRVGERLADTSVLGRVGRRASEAGDEPGTVERPERLCDADRSGPTNGLWRDADWLGCRDGKWRPVEPGAFPLAHGATARVGRLRGYGNAIVAPQAQAFVEAVMSCV